MVLWCILAFLIVAADQLAKYLIVNGLSLGESFEVIPGIIDFTYVKNTGAAFSMLSNATWFLSVLSVVFCIAVAIYFFWKKPEHKLLKTALILIFAGAFGNAIDRITLGYVVDFIQTVFIDFPVFNVADIAITIGAALLIIYELFFNPEGKEEPYKKNREDEI